MKAHLVMVAIIPVRVEGRVVVVKVRTVVVHETEWDSETDGERGIYMKKMREWVDGLTALLISLSASRTT